jgi:hypothetical protein
MFQSSKYKLTNSLETVIGIALAPPPRKRHQNPINLLAFGLEYETTAHQTKRS